MSFEWKGVFPAMTTPFNSADELDIPLFINNMDAQLSAGVDGIILGGTLGEASVLTIEEKERLVKSAVERLGQKIPVVLNIAEGSTRSAIEQINLASQWGASGLMLLPPMRYKSDHRETVYWFKTLADATDLPIMIYNNPLDYRVEVTLDMFEELTGCKNIQAVKESTRDVTNVTRMLNRFGDRYKILCGVDTLAMEELCLGATGWVAGLVCAFPVETVKLYRLIKEVRLKEALEINRWFMPLLELDIVPKLVQYIKLAQQCTGLSNEIVRAPRLALQGEERASVLNIIEAAISNRPKMDLIEEKIVSYA